MSQLEMPSTCLEPQPLDALTTVRLLIFIGPWLADCTRRGCCRAESKWRTLGGGGGQLHGSIEERERLKSHLLDVCVRAQVVPPNIGTNRPICIDHLRAYFVVVVWDLYSTCTLLNTLTESVREIDWLIPGSKLDCSEWTAYEHHTSINLRELQ